MDRHPRNRRLNGRSRELERNVNNVARAATPIANTRAATGRNCCESTGDDDSGADGLVSVPGSLVAGGEVGVMFHCSEGHKRVVDGAAGDPDLAKDVGDTSGHVGAEEERWAEPLSQKVGGVQGRQPGISGKAGEHGIGLDGRVATQRDLPMVPPAGDGGVGGVVLYEQRYSDAGVEGERLQRRPPSRSPKMSSSSIAVSARATSTPDSSTSRAVRPVGTSWSPAP